MAKHILLVDDDALMRRSLAFNLEQSGYRATAAANAEDKSGGDADIDNLRISHISVDGGPIIKRWMPRAMGRANRINHRTSHLTVVVSDDA